MAGQAKKSDRSGSSITKDDITKEELLWAYKKAQEELGLESVDELKNGDESKNKRKWNVKLPKASLSKINMQKINATFHFIVFVAMSLFPPVQPRWLKSVEALGSSEPIPDRFIFLFQDFSSKRDLVFSVLTEIDLVALSIEWIIALVSFLFFTYLLRG